MLFGNIQVTASSQVDRQSKQFYAFPYSSGLSERYYPQSSPYYYAPFNGQPSYGQFTFTGFCVT